MNDSVSFHLSIVIAALLGLAAAAGLAVHRIYRDNALHMLVRITCDSPLPCSCWCTE
jgi:hypothetical protein